MINLLAFSSVMTILRVNNRAPESEGKNTVFGNIQMIFMKVFVLLFIF